MTRVFPLERKSSFFWISGLPIVETYQAACATCRFVEVVQERQIQCLWRLFDCNRNKHSAIVWRDKETFNQLPPFLLHPWLLKVSQSSGSNIFQHPAQLLKVLQQLGMSPFADPVFYILGFQRFPAIRHCVIHYPTHWWNFNNQPQGQLYYLNCIEIGTWNSKPWKFGLLQAGMYASSNRPHLPCFMSISVV